MRLHRVLGTAAYVYGGGGVEPSPGDGLDLEVLGGVLGQGLGACT